MFIQLLSVRVITSGMQSSVCYIPSTISINLVSVCASHLISLSGWNSKNLLKAAHSTLRRLLVFKHVSVAVSKNYFMLVVCSSGWHRIHIFANNNPYLDTVSFSDWTTWRTVILVES